MLRKLKRLFTSSSDIHKSFKEWDENGFLVLKKFFNADDLKAFDNEINHIFENRERVAGDITIDVLEGNLTGKRLKLKNAPDEAIKSAHKVNDLYLESAACRNLNLNQELCRILEGILNDEPLVINSLTFTKGSQQPHHFDTYYMPPPIRNQMVVTSICLEDQHPDTGPLSYYPGSHKIKPYVFSSGRIDAIPAEMEKATEYIKTKIEKAGLKQETFVGNAGDVFIWHAQLYHGGLPIIDQERTRKTLVTHYWRKNDVKKNRVASINAGGSYLIRKHQEV